jgi:hypothetical protein
MSATRSTLPAGGENSGRGRVLRVFHGGDRQDLERTNSCCSDRDAGCSLEESCRRTSAALQATNPRFYTIAYINCSAAVKALSDVIRTSGNARKDRPGRAGDRDLVRSGRKPGSVGDGTDRTSDDAVERQLLRARRVPARRPGAASPTIPEAKAVCIRRACARCAISRMKFVRPSA